MRSTFRPDHAAFMTWDVEATHDFYTRVMGWPLAMAWGREDFFQVGFDAGAFTIEFEEQVGVERVSQSPAPGFPHFGLEVPDVEALAAWRAHFDECGVEYLDLGVEVFISDPNGVSFQVFAPRQSHGTPEEVRATSEANLAAWLAR